MLSSHTDTHYDTSQEIPAVQGHVTLVITTLAQTQTAGYDIFNPLDFLMLV